VGMSYYIYYLLWKRPIENGVNGTTLTDRLTV